MALSARYALTPQELLFCRIFGTGVLARTESYRRAFLAKLGDSWYEVGPDGRIPVDSDNQPKEEPLASRAITKRAEALVGAPQIVAYLEELKRPAGQTARSVLEEQAALGEGADSRRAAEKLIELEDRLGHMSATERWAQIVCEIGAEVVVPVPDCPACGHSYAVAVDVNEVFPQFAVAEEEREAVTEED